MEQPTATIIAAVVGVSGSLAAAIIAVWWKREPKHHIIEYRLRHESPDIGAKWLHGDSPTATLIRGAGWVVVFLTVMVGVQFLFLLIGMWVFSDEAPNRVRSTLTLFPWSILSLITARWIAKRIEKPAEIEDQDDD